MSLTRVSVQPHVDNFEDVKMLKVFPLEIVFDQHNSSSGASLPFSRYEGMNHNAYILF